MRGAENERQLWWWRVAAPPVIVLVATWWSLFALGDIQTKSGQRLYALFAQTDSAGTGEIFWKPNGWRDAFRTIELPYYAGILGLLVTTTLGGVRYRKSGSWIELLGVISYGVVAALALSAIFGWLWINVIGVFI
jgi:hypothetical protein